MTHRISVSKKYIRKRDIPALLPCSSFDLTDTPSPKTKKMIIAALECAVQAEYRLGIERAWAYCPRRHLALKTALEAERQR